MLQDLVEAVDKLILTKMNELHTAIPAKIDEFDPAKCTATVKPFGKMVLTNGKTFDSPKINGVPVLFTHANSLNSLIVFPVKAGDICLLIFSEQALDNWRSNGTKNSELKYALTNAVAIPGLFAQAPNEVAESVDKNAIIVKNTSTKVRIFPEKVELETPDKVKVTSQNLEAEYSTKVKATSPIFEITGDVKITGNVTVTGNITSSGNVSASGSVTGSGGVFNGGGELVT